MGGAAARIVSRTVAADKVSGTSSDTSRTTDGKRGSGSTRVEPCRAIAVSRSRSSSHTNTTSPRGNPWASAIGAASSPVVPIVSPSATTRAARPATSHAVSTGSNVGATPNVVLTASTTPVRSKKSTSRRWPLQ